VQREVGVRKNADLGRVQAVELDFLRYAQGVILSEILNHTYAMANPNTQTTAQARSWAKNCDGSP